MKKLTDKAVATAAVGLLPCLLLSLATNVAMAQDEEDSDTLEEIVVTGSQIKGARITDALAVSVFSAEDIEILGVESGEELLNSIPEMGQNFFNETDTAGSVNAARGDVGAVNLRNLGTGNTLTLLNGRRMVNMATYQTEEVGGAFVPVNSVNSRHIPVYGLDRLDVFRDGASALYGADAVAGVINSVMKDDFEGFTVRLRYSDYDNIPRNDEFVGIEWGDSFNGGATHVGVFAEHYRRDRINSLDDPRWASSDFRLRLPEGNPYSLNGADGIPDSGDESTVFRNDSAESAYGRFDVIPSLGSSHSLRVNDVTDSAGEFELFPADYPDCAGTFYIIPSTGVCAREDSSARGYRLDYGAEGRDLISELERTIVYGYVNHEVNADVEAFSEFYFYDSKTNKVNSAVADLGSVILRVGASNYYNPLGRATIDGQPNPNRFPDPTGEIYADVPDSGYDLYYDLGRFTEAPRNVNNDGQASRLLFGLRGTEGDWDWESAVVWSEATRDDITTNRISNTLLTHALYDPTPSAYNPFAGGDPDGIEQALVSMYRKGRSTLTMWDFKMSNPEIFELPAGPVGFLMGYEWRRETYVDNRDPRLDGTIVFMRESDPINAPGVYDIEGDFDSCDPETTPLGCSADGFDTYPVTSDIVGASPTPDGRGSRTTNSVFAEFQVPLHRTLDLQLAARYESFDDIGDTAVGRVAFGWRPFEPLLFRGSWSTAFRAPNLITINEEFVARANTRDDWVCQFADDLADNGTAELCDRGYSMQRQATGSKDLEPEESVNTSLGVVIQPLKGLTLTIDYWTIEKDDTIGLFGEENHILYDLVLRLEAGTANCASVQGNPVVVRRAFDPDDDELIDGYLNAGLCPVGTVDYVADNYLNLETLDVEGYDIGAYYDFDTAIGEFSLRYNGAFYDKYEIIGVSNLSNAILRAKEANPDITYPLQGLGDLLGLDGNQESRQRVSAIWRNGDWRVGLSGLRISDFNEFLSDETLWKIPAMTTYNATVDYTFDVSDVSTRVRFAVNNFTDERAPLADESFGFFSDAHSDWGRYYYVDVRMRF
jgi:outer membrane receptor protein involved in Fe transport